jgi:hypothetical protein
LKHKLVYINKVTFNIKRKKRLKRYI